MKILIGITGSIAAIKMPDLIHKLVQAGNECKVIITQDGLNFITPISVASMRTDVYTDNDNYGYRYSVIMEHINLAKWADYIMIVPSSANTIAKLAHGLSDNLLTATVLASDAKKILVPAMNQQMWKSLVLQDNVKQLLKYDFLIWGPVSGIQACGDIDVGRMMEVDEIIAKINLLTTTGTKLKGKTIIITGGRTIEPIDPVRYISNYSSGKMAYALAGMAISMGANVILVSGKADLEPPQGLIKFCFVDTAYKMLDVVKNEAKHADIFIACAAVCDYRVKELSEHKIKKNSDIFALELIKNPDIVATVRNNYPKLYTVGFAAETQNLIENAMAKIKSKNLDLIIANDVSQGVFGADINQVTIIDKQLKQTKLPRGSKSVIAKAILEIILDYTL
ncbi:MAG: bifunctional phosphopantothenoylcysteine decarboxylase/phosphopantothenate--cysteine ligase CoaBC [Burkholderiales bacterium]|nr:bifunctional phosphopantothenoylcysteine decarboxylase/phosphopantothenate--cysteine ligase CoaBC [Burkholderiales bacterium]